jgi:hypothetical protein
LKGKGCLWQSLRTSWASSSMKRPSNRLEKVEIWWKTLMLRANSSLRRIWNKVRREAGTPNCLLKGRKRS